MEGLGPHLRQPAALDPASPRYLRIADALIALAEAHVDSTLGEFREAVRDFIGGATDHRLQRGLAHLLEERLRRLGYIRFRNGTTGARKIAVPFIITGRTP